MATKSRRKRSRRRNPALQLRATVHRASGDYVWTYEVDAVATLSSAYDELDEGLRDYLAAMGQPGDVATIYVGGQKAAVLEARDTHGVLTWAHRNPWLMVVGNPPEPCMACHRAPAVTATEDGWALCGTCHDHSAHLSAPTRRYGLPASECGWCAPHPCSCPGARKIRPGPWGRRRNPDTSSGHAAVEFQGNVPVDEIADWEGYADAQQRALPFHGREAEEAMIFQVDDGQPGVERRVLVALGAVPETVYQVPDEWESSKENHIWVHKHPAGKEPIEALDPVTGLTMKLPRNPKAKITDYWYA